MLSYFFTRWLQKYGQDVLYFTIEVFSDSAFSFIEHFKKSSQDRVIIFFLSDFVPNGAVRANWKRFDLTEANSISLPGQLL